MPEDSGLVTPLAGRTVYITGASDGLGAALAAEMSREGYAVGLIARRADVLDTVAGKLPGPNAWAVADVSDSAALAAAITRLRETLPPPDIAVANAGISLPDDDEFASAVAMAQVNYLGTVHLFNHVLPSMVERGSGHIVAVSSLAGMVGFPGKVGYCGSKAAVDRFVEACRPELRRKGVHVTLIRPGGISTKMIKGNQYAGPFNVEPDYAARRIHRAIKRRQRVCEFPWQHSVAIRIARLLPEAIRGRISLRKDAVPPGN
jgi:short-subunit dehydrogenase